MSNPRIEMLEYRVDRIEQHMENWDKLLHGIETTITVILKDQEVMKSDISVLKQDVNQLALGQIKLMETTSRIENQQSQMMAILLKIIDRLP